MRLVNSTYDALISLHHHEQDEMVLVTSHQVHWHRSQHGEIPLLHLYRSVHRLLINSSYIPRDASLATLSEGSVGG